MSMPIVTLTTDWGEEGFFSGMVKGLLYSNIEGVRVVDITHRLEAYNIMTATFVVRHACLGFPAGTVHIVDVATRPPLLCVKVRGQYFFCCDNGLPTMAFADEVEDLVVLPVQEGGVYNFAAYNVFAMAAAKLARGAALSDLGSRPGQLVQRTMPRFIQQGDSYRIYVHYVDAYGNAYLGMTYREFESLRAGRQFVLAVRDQEVSELMSGYYQQHQTNDPRRKLRLTVSATGLLELAVKESSLAQLVGLKVNESVLLRFK